MFSAALMVVSLIMPGNGLLKYNKTLGYEITWELA
jgi:hypothetical protein